MFNRRLLILFVAFFLGFGILVLRLAKLQLVEAQLWRGRVAQFLHPQYSIESYRGMIVDRNGQVLARDVPSDELAIDYRAISFDDDWLTKKAADQLRAQGKWGDYFSSRAQRNLAIEEIKPDLYDKIQAIPHAVAEILSQVDHISVEEELEIVLQRYSEISQKIHAIRQDVWSRKYSRDTAAQAPSSGDRDSEVDDSALDAMFRQIQLKDEVAAHTLRANLPPQVALYFKQHAADFPGLVVRDMSEYNRREYPFGEATAHVVGTLRSIGPDALADHRFREPNLLADNEAGDLSGYLPGDKVGETGIERLSEDILHGTRGERLLDLSDQPTQPSGAAAGAPSTDARRIEPIPGKTVQLTLDAAMQRDIYTSLKDPAKHLLKADPDDPKDHFVAIVVLSMDGQILSLVSYPSYDPNTFDATRAQLMRDNYQRPLVNRATSEIYHPGSTVKPLLSVAALSEHVMTPTETVHCVGHFYPSRSDIFRCEEVHGDVSMVRAIAESCNVYFYTVGERLGVERETQWYSRFGFGADTGMEMGEARGNLPSPSQRIDPDTLKSDALLMGIGQGPIDATPLQMANAYATLLRGGIAVAPRILAATPPRQSRVMQIPAQDLALIRQGMEQCTVEGTGKDIFGKFHLRVAGKTGTAEMERKVFDDKGNPIDDPLRPLVNPDGSPKLKPDGTPAFRQLMERHSDSWFIGYAPADKPQFIVAAIMEWGGYGGKHAAPLVREAFAQLESHGYLPRTDVP
ncbi:MAG TPA: penicillin-binding transpeptidase domain-containing protein [Phycisphaerae bacterium]|jgi:penicillin-binding protein 2